MKRGSNIKLTLINLTFSSNEHGFGDVNISAILNSFQMGYDKRVRPNYGGKFRVTGKIQIISIEPLQEKLSQRLAELSPLKTSTNTTVYFVQIFLKIIPYAS